MLERLQKIIARAGIASRRHAEELIVSGQVKVNGVVVTELGAKADPEHDKIEAAGRMAEQPEAARYYILNKPPHVVSTMSDPEGRATLRHVLRGLSGGIFPVGRLDYATSGLILLTSDGQLADSIFKVSSSFVKVFWIKLSGRPDAATLSKITHKAQVRLRPLRTPDAAMGAGHPVNPWYEAELRGPRRDVLRQSFFEADFPVEKSKRVRFGPLELGDLPEGQYRQLTPSEVESLKRAVEKALAQGSAESAPVPPPVRAFERKKWRANADRDRIPGLTARPGESGAGARSGVPKFGGDRFAASGKGAPGRGGAAGGRLFPPRSDRPFPPRGPRPFAPKGDRPFRPRDDRGGPGGEKRGPRPGGGGAPRFGGDRFAAGGKGAPGSAGKGGRPFAPRGDRPFPPRGDRPFVPKGSRPFRPRDERNGFGSESRGPRPGGGGPRGDRPNFGGNRFAPGGKGASGRGATGGGRPFPPRGGRPFAPKGDRPFRPREDRGGPGGGSRGAGKPGGFGDKRGGFAGRGRGNFSPRPPHAGGPAGGKFRGKRPPARPVRRPENPEGESQ